METRLQRLESALDRALAREAVLYSDVPGIWRLEALPPTPLGHVPLTAWLSYEGAGVDFGFRTEFRRDRTGAEQAARERLLRATIHHVTARFPPAEQALFRPNR